MSPLTQGLNYRSACDLVPNDGQELTKMLPTNSLTNFLVRPIVYVNKLV